MKAKIMNGDHYQHLQDKEKEEAGESKAEEAKESPAQEAAEEKTEDRMPPRMRAKTSKAKKGAGLNSVMKD